MPSSRAAFGEMVRDVRKSAGITLPKAALGASCTASFLCDLELGRRSCSLKMAVRLARALTVDPELFVERLLQERLDAAGVAMTVRVELSEDARAAADLDVRTWEGDRS